MSASELSGHIPALNCILFHHGQDADVGEVTPRRRPGSRREDGRRGDATPDRGNLPAESGKPAAAAAAEERSAAAGASAAGPRSAR